MQKDLKTGIKDPIYITYVLALKFNEPIGTYMSWGGGQMHRSTITVIPDDYYGWFVKNDIRCERV